MDEDVEIDVSPAEKLSPSQRMALRLYVLGKTDGEIAEATGYSLGRISQLKKIDGAQEYLKECEAELDEEFKRLHKKVIDVIEAGLDCADATISLAAANMWLKSHGKFVTRTESRDLTAEDIVKKIISGELQPRKRLPIQLDGVVVSEESDADKSEVTH